MHVQVSRYNPQKIGSSSRYQFEQGNSLQLVLDAKMWMLYIDIAVVYSLEFIHDIKCLFEVYEKHIQRRLPPYRQFRDNT